MKTTFPSNNEWTTTFYKLFYNFKVNRAKNKCKITKYKILRVSWDNYTLMPGKVVNVWKKIEAKNWNSKMRSQNGNARAFLYQNIPCTYRSRTAEVLILDIIQRFKPVCLFLGEIGKEVLEDCLVPGYTLIVGNRTGNDRIRMNCFIQDSCQYTVKNMTCQMII